MDRRLLDWAHAVKARRGHGLPPLWLFTDPQRLPDPLQAAARLPRGLAGVVLRHDEAATRKTLGRALARICRQRRLALVIAGDARLAASLRAGVHLRRGRRPGAVRLRPGIRTSSAHGQEELRRARLAGADLVFLSPVFPTASHAGAPALGVVRWASMAGKARLPVAALGGVDGGTLRRLPRARCAGLGAIGAFLSVPPRPQHEARAIRHMRVPLPIRGCGPDIDLD